MLTLPATSVSPMQRFRAVLQIINKQMVHNETLVVINRIMKG